MSQKKFNIRTKSYMPLTPDGEEKVCLCDLNNGQKDYLGTLLKTRFLNMFYAGDFQFWTEDMPPMKEMFPNDLPQTADSHRI